jgi:SAM-dependent methyltransferase
VNDDLSVLREPGTGAPLRREGDALVGPSGGSYPIVGGIPRFVGPENYAADFGKQWNAFPRTQLDSHTGLPVSGDRLRRCLNGEYDRLAGRTVLEAGSGAGRFTELLLAAGATVHSFDFSSAVEANAANHADQDRLTLVQADIRSMPFAQGAYDYVVCLGVIQHTPSPEESIAALWRMVAPGGRLVIDHYRFRWRFALPTPVGDAGSVFRWLALRLPARRRAGFSRRLTDFWFPVHWRFRDSLLAQRLIRRLSPMRFHYPDLKLRDRDMHYEWSLLDTHDALTDHYKHLRSPAEIEALLRQLGADEIKVTEGGNGVEAWCVKPTS